MFEIESALAHPDEQRYRWNNEDLREATTQQITPEEKNGGEKMKTTTTI